MKKYKKPELLAPAGNLEKLKIAITYGADAVFLGGEEFGLRSGAGNFTYQEIAEGVEFAKKHNARVYVTTNIFAHNENYQGFKEFVLELERFGVTGIIVSDPGYIKITQEATDLEIHISTQQSIMNHHAVNFFDDLGADRVVLGRELSAPEIKTIAEKTKVELEIFIHGAVCSSYSGRCTLSNHMTMRDSNRGGCCQSCRWEYDLVAKDSASQKYQKVINSEQEDDAFNMSAKDMNLLSMIPELMELGVDSFKIEGRMKSFHYVATVVKVYRAAIDAFYEDPDNYFVKEKWIEELQTAESRPSNVGSFAQEIGETSQIFGSQYQSKKFDYCGIILQTDEKSGYTIIEQRNFFKIGDTLEVTGPGITPFHQKILAIYDEEDNEISKANHPLMRVKMKFEKQVFPNYILRKGN